MVRGKWGQEEINLYPYGEKELYGKKNSYHRKDKTSYGMNNIKF